MSMKCILHLATIVAVICVRSSHQTCVDADMADYTDCGGILIGNEGVVKRPSQNYRKSAYCKWTITQDEGFGFKIKVKNMKLEDESSVHRRCNDNLMIESQSGQIDTDNKEKKILCGYDHDAADSQQDEEENFFIPTRQINVTFCSSVLPEDKIETDFQLKWSVVTVQEQPDADEEPIPFMIEEFKAPSSSQERRMQCRQGMCHPNAVCRETMFGRAKCVCRPGYMGDGKQSCIDINECHESQATPACHPNATCINLAGSFTCRCPVGFSGDGQTCTEKPHGAPRSGGCRFDSCEAESDCIASVDGGHYCVCKDGYSGDGYECRDIDECVAESGSASVVCGGFRGTCENTVGSYICHHPSQYLPIVAEGQQQQQQQQQRDEISDYMRLIQRLRDMHQSAMPTEEATTAVFRRPSILERIRARVVRPEDSSSSSTRRREVVTDSPSSFESETTTTTTGSGNEMITSSRVLVVLQTALVTAILAVFG